MNASTVVAFLILGLAIGAASVWYVTRSRIRRLSAQNAEEEAAAKEREAVSGQAELRMREAFAAASRDALEANSRVFLDLARVSMSEFQQGARTDLESRQQSIDRMVGPVNEGLQRMDAALRLLDRDRTTTQATLVEHLRHMALDQQKLVGETETLVRALRTPHVRGQWGEMQLRRAVELAGMLEHCDFATQQTVQTEDGRLRPDLIVNLPLGKVVVVDAKAPLYAYLEAMEVADEHQRARLIDRHAAQVRAHIDALAAKDYSNQFPNAPDFVVLFLPGEAFFSAACERDPAIVDYAIGLGVIPASPTTLITLLKSVAYGWQQERIAERAEEIRDLGIELYERVGTFAEHIAKVRKGLDGAVCAYNSAVGSLETRVLPTARRLREIGGNGTAEIAVLEMVVNVPRFPATSELGIVELVSSVPAAGPPSVCNASVSAAR
jgi:DNA recombination protein RmuC